MTKVIAAAMVCLLLATGCGTGGGDVNAPPLVTAPSDPTAPSSSQAPAPTDPEDPVVDDPDETTTTAAAPPLPEVTVEQIECPVDIRSGDLSCGLATVPVDRDDPTAGTTTISIAILHGSDSESPTPLAVLQGGPGGSSTDLTRFYPPRAFTQVFIDQRGTGFGGSDFDCPEVDAVLVDILSAPSAIGEVIELAAYERCAARLGDDPVLASTDTATLADDVTDVMAALGYERWLVYGVSYGTTIALQLMRSAPRGLEGAVLDSVYPIDLDIDVAIAESSLSSLAELDRACAADPVCDAILADVDGTLIALMDRLRVDPITVPVDAGETLLDVDLDVVIDDEVLAGMVFRFLYDESRFRFVPGMLDGLDRGDPGTARWLARRVVDMSVSGLGANDDGTWFAVQCADRLPFTNGPPSDLSGYAAAIAVPGLDELCEPWDRVPAPPTLAEPVRSDIPALIVGGQFDPITPPAYADRVAADLTTATVAIRLGRGHGVWFGDDCVAALIDAFVSDPGGALDTSCADELVPVNWRRPDAG